MLHHGQLVLIRRGARLEPAIFNKLNAEGDAEVFSDVGNFCTVKPTHIRPLSSFAPAEDECGLHFVACALIALASAGDTASYCWWLWG